METFAPTRPLIDDPRFAESRTHVLSGLEPAMIDAPIRELVARLNAWPFCFTLQCCYGHFVYAEQSDAQNLAPLPGHDVGEVEYRIAYLALVIENGHDGARLLERLAAVTRIDPDYVQFGSPGWFRERHVNAYAFQVEPERFANRDKAFIGYREALHVQQVRDDVFAELDQCLDTNRK
jgi:hypothetical protein